MRPKKISQKSKKDKNEREKINMSTFINTIPENYLDISPKDLTIDSLPRRLLNVHDLKSGQLARYEKNKTSYILWRQKGKYVVEPYNAYPDRPDNYSYR